MGVENPDTDQINPLLRRVIVIGGGASGLMAAGVAAKRGLHVTVLERNSQCGRKLHISGKGRCNITNDTDVAGLMANIPHNEKFLRRAFYAFGPEAVKSFFTGYGVPTKTESGRRVFPVSDNADDVIRALEHFCADGGVEIVLSAAVRRIIVDNQMVRAVQIADGRVFSANAVILSTGGAAYPGTGSKGDGYRMARELGHTIIPVRPSLVPLETEETWPAEVQGLSLRNVALSCCLPDGKKFTGEIGELLFTHFGVSGPLVLTASRHAGNAPGSLLIIDLKPGLSEAELDLRIQRDFSDQRRREFANALHELLPRTLIPVIIRLSHIPPHTYVHNITRAQRQSLAHLLKSLPLTVKRTRSFEEAIITVGGVSTREIDAGTMQSKLIAGLYFTGEVIDVDGYTGGYNLQIAWSTGYLAGENVCPVNYELKITN